MKKPIGSQIMKPPASIQDTAAAFPEEAPRVLRDSSSRGALNMIQRSSFLMGLAVLSLLMGIRAPLQASEPSEGLKPEKLNVGFLQSAFLGVNQLDAEAAFKTFARTIGVSYGYDIDVTVRIVEHVGELESLPSGEKTDLIILDSWSYLEMDDAEWLEPVFVSSDRGRVASRYLLLTRHDRNLKTLTDLRGKSLNLLAASNAMLGIPWLQALLREQKLGSPEAFFGVVEYHTDPMPTVLQVFFGKKDAALVDAIKFELMAELNPQLNRLHAIQASEPLVNSIICLKRSGWASERFRQDMVQAMAELHLKPAGQQIITLFKFGRMVPFEQSHLDTVRGLRKTAAPLQHKTPGSPGSLGNMP